MLWSGHPIHPGSDQLIASSVSYKRLLGLGQTARLVRTAAIHLFFSAVSGCTAAHLANGRVEKGVAVGAGPGRRRRQHRLTAGAPAGLPPLPVLPRQLQAGR